MNKEPLLKMEKISKAFPGVQALDEVDFEAYKGAVTALVGENGAGKSTLMKILAGAYKMDKGRIFLRGEEVKIESPQQARDLGIAIIYQEFNLTPNQTVANNLFLGREPKIGGVLRPLNIVDSKNMYRESQGLLEMVGAKVSPRDLVKDLPVAQQQMVEIAKALAVEAEIIVMDEPTSALGEDEVAVLFDIIRNLKNQGISVIFITHRLEEVFEVADRVVVLRDGKRVGSMDIEEASPDRVIKSMVGRTLDTIFPKEETKIGGTVLEVKNFSRGEVVKNVSFTLRRGEILGFAGLIGAGRTEMAMAIFGFEKKDAGEIWVEGQLVDIDSPRAAVRAGLGLVPEERQLKGLILKLAVKENIVLPSLENFASMTVVDRGRVKSAVTDYVARLDIRTPSLDQKVMFLSGGNQQKVVLAKWLLLQPKVLILDEPTRGIDVGAKAEVHALMSQLAQQGIGIIMISSEMPEIMGMSDRIVVMAEGRVAAVLDREEATPEKIMAYASGEGVMAD